MIDRCSVGVGREHFDARLQQVNEVAARSASGVEDPHAPPNAAAKQLVEQVNIYLAELALEVAHLPAR